MTRHTRKRLMQAVSVSAALALALSACAKTDSDSGADSGNNSSSGEASGGIINIGTTDRITSLDPAGAYDHGSSSVANNVYPMLMNIPLGGKELDFDIATSAEFTDPSTYQVKIKEGLKFANGHDLTSSDVKFSFDRMKVIDDPEGPQSLLYNLESVATPDDLTVEFTLKVENDVTFGQILTTPAAFIVDEEVFSATELTPAEKIVSEKAFGGPYMIETFKENSLISYAPNPNYMGLYPVQNEKVNVQYLADETNLKQAVENGDLDVAYRTLSPTAVIDIEENSADTLTVHKGPGGEVRYMVFNTDSMAYGAKTEQADPAKALAVRQAVADVIDRAAIAADVYKDTFAPAYSMVPSAMAGAAESFKALYGDGEGGPSVDKAKARLSEAGVDTPVKLTIQYSPDHYGASSTDEYGAIKSQLEASGLFTVDLQSTSWTTYSSERIEGYPTYQLGWFPDFSDADNYLSPFFLDSNFVQSYNSALEDSYQELISASAVETDSAKRAELLTQAQDELAKHVLTLPLLFGTQIAVAGNDVEGIVLDASFKFHYSPITK